VDYQTQDRFEAFNSMATAVARFDPSGVLTYANDEGLRLLGVQSGEHVDLAMLLPDVTELCRVKHPSSARGGPEQTDTGQRVCLARCQS
jgi:PAS domain-containing protein